LPAALPLFDTDDAQGVAVFDDSYLVSLMEVMPSRAGG
jgi:hypothetical protein